MSERKAYHVASDECMQRLRREERKIKIDNFRPHTESLRKAFESYLEDKTISGIFNNETKLT